MFRRLSAATENRIRDAAAHFLASGKVEDSTVLLDGPGIGCTSHTLVLGFLGMERVLLLHALHSMSSSAYGTLFFLAQHLGELTLKKDQADGWNRRNQLRHKTGYPFQIFSALPHFVRHRAMFPHDRTFEALACTVSPAFVQRKVSSLPPNLHFWVYNQTDSLLEDISSSNPAFSDWTLGEVIRATVSIPFIYRGFERNGKTYQDPMFSPSIREKMRALRTGKNVLFWNMAYSARKPGLTAVKGHDSKGSVSRIVADEMLFLTGFGNPEFDQGMRKGLFETQPL